MRIEIKNLVRHFGKTRAVNDISFEFGSGDVYGFVGPNGSGKTTTMRILATLDEPTSGDILLDGVSVLEYPEQARQRLGFMPDSLPAHGDITVEEYIDFFARSYGLKGKQRRQSVEGVIEFTNLGGIRWKMLSALSKGMKQRVSLARAMVHDPSLLIMDEPAAGLDPRARVELRELLKVLRDQGKAVLISSHILTELSEICSGAVIIERGKVLRAGNIHDMADGHHVAGHTELFVRAIDMETESLARLALEAPMVSQASVVQNGKVGVRIMVTISPELTDGRLVTPDENHSEILQFLISRQVRIVEFSPRKVDLEDVFMALTEGKVQ